MVYKTRPIKRRKRRSKEDIQDIKNAIYRVLMDEHPMTVRQVFYQLVSLGVIDKTEKEYKNTVCRLVKDMRLEHSIPFGWIADNTRWMRKPRTYSGLREVLEAAIETYRRSIWQDANCYIEIWLEKDALAGVLYQITAEWDVPLMVTRGYPSITYLYEAAEAICERGKPTYLYYFGDRDPSGVDIPRNVEDRIREFAPDIPIHFECVAVTEEQIQTLNLPTRPTKSSDSRAKNFEGESVEVDAIPPRQLRQLVRNCIEAHVDLAEFERIKRVEEQERLTLATLARRNQWLTDL